MPDAAARSTDGATADFALRFDPGELPTLAKAYGSEQDDTALAAGARIRHGDHTRENLAAIFEWKIEGRGRSRLLQNTEGEIADALRLAVEAKTDRAAASSAAGPVRRERPGRLGRSHCDRP